MLKTPPQTYRDTWEPLVGDAATGVLWKTDLRRSVYAIAIWVFAAASSFGFYVWVPLGAFLFALSMGCVFLRLQENAKLASALSDYFGVPIARSEVPLMTPEGFAKASKRKGWTPAAMQLDHPACVLAEAHQSAGHEASDSCDTPGERD